MSRFKNATFCRNIWVAHETLVSHGRVSVGTFADDQREAEPGSEQVKKY
jgi:hypothetical protein